MKKPVFVAFAVLTTTILAPQTNAQNIHLGGGLSYGTGSKALSFRGSMVYNVPESPLRIGTNLGYITRKHHDKRWSDQLYGNINGYLIAIQNPDFTLYGLTGLNLSHYKTIYTPDRQPSYSVSDFYPGANVGIGMEHNIGIGIQFMEAKYLFGDEDIRGFVFNTGVSVSI